MNKASTPKGRRGPARRLPIGASPVAKAGLKISFRPAELNQTTDKAVIQQVSLYTSYNIYIHK